MREAGTGIIAYIWIMQELLKDIAVNFLSDTLWAIGGFIVSALVLPFLKKIVCTASSNNSLGFALLKKTSLYRFSDTKSLNSLNFPHFMGFLFLKKSFSTYPLL